MVDVPRTDFQGDILAQKEKSGGGWTGLVTPYSDPMDWYIQPFPSRFILEEYAVKYSLKIIEEEKKDEDTIQKRAGRA